MKKEKVIPIIFDTYIAVVKNSVGSKMFRNSYAKINDKKTDILQNGMFSCAFFVSSILVLFKLIKRNKPIRKVEAIFFNKKLN